VIRKIPDVCGGAAVFEGTRIPVWLIVWCRQCMTDAEILEAYPALKMADIWEAREYAWNNPEEINDAIEENERA
jgi:uncharacterized protein (DUF433 family)